MFPDQEGIALKLLSNLEMVEMLRVEVEQSGFNSTEMRLVFVDGYLLYNNPTIRQMLDVKLFFRLSHKVAKERRFTRQGYGPEAKEGEFWKTEDYFEKMVWSSYQEQHGFMFADGDIEGEINEETCKKAELRFKPGMNGSVEEGVVWSVSQITDGLRAKLLYTPLSRDQN